MEKDTKTTRPLPDNTNVSQPTTPDSGNEKLTSEDLKNIVEKGELPLTNSTEQNELMGKISNDYKSSKIVKFGFWFLWLIWSIVIIGKFKLVGLAVWGLISLGIIISGHYYRKKGSVLAQRIYYTLIAAMFAIIFALYPNIR